MMEDDLWWKTTYDGRRLILEDDLWHIVARTIIAGLYDIIQQDMLDYII